MDQNGLEHVTTLTSRISELDIVPGMSCLFAKINSDAPASRCHNI
jgi:hypothetical protein